ncbi:MAG: SUMF1/EgtB/PvdO family nonheme iron enzyme [Planctomycetes bacterium]|nr:SUMF1/EgtB/PvdO family nonheme iron enzyme [Planctomycetota bacterium]
MSFIFLALTAEQFGKAVVTSGLITADELKTLWAELPAAERPKDGESFAKLLVKRERLNEFQAQELLSGGGTPLVLNQYVLLSKIGAGGMGQVFKAQHRKMKRLAAVKLLPAALTKDDAAVKRFQREVEAAAKLSHPNIVQTFDADECRGIHFMVMEYVEGKDLSAIVKERGPLPVQAAVDYILQAARGLAFAHSKGVVHRDIKPANLLLDNDGTVKILDMGLARIDDGNPADHQLTNTGTVMGTVDYMPPEQANDTRKADARSDIYSLGCSLYRILTGESVFGGETVVQKIMAHMGDPIPSLCSKRPDVSAEIDRIYQKMLAKRPDDRYQHASQLVAELEAWKSPRADGGSSPALPSDPQLSNFLQSINPPKGTGTSTLQLSLQTVVKTEQTMTYAGPELDTDPKSEIVSALVAKAKASPSAVKPKTGGKGGKKPPVRLIAAGAAGFLFVLLGVILVIKNDKGETVAEVKVADGNAVEVKLPPGGSVQVKPDNATAAVPKATVPLPQSVPTTPAVVATAAPSTASVAASPAAVVYLDDLEEKSYEGLNKSFHRLSQDQAQASLIRAEYPSLSPAHALIVYPDNLKANEKGTNAGVAALVYELTGPFDRFQARALTQASGRTDPVFVEVWGDGKKLWESGNLLPTKEAGATVDVDLRGVRELKLIARAENRSANSRVFWIDPRLTPAAIPSPLTPAPSTTIPAEALTFNGHRYLLVESEGAWIDAKAKAESLGGHLVTITTKEENDWIRDNLLQVLTPGRMAWIGAGRGATGPWAWVTGEPFEFSDWIPRDSNTIHAGAGFLFGETSGYKWAEWPNNTNPIAPSGAVQGQSRCAGFLVEWDTLGPAIGTSQGSAPPIAKAPFDAAQATAHQAAWAKHLGTEVVKPNSIGMQMVLIPPGEFMMGSSDADVTLALKIAEETKLDKTSLQRIQEERPQHRVRITKPFRLCAHELTIGQFAKFVEQAKYKTQAEEFGGNSSTTKLEEARPDRLTQTWRTPGLTATAITDDSPVTQVSWNDAVAFCNWLSGQEKLDLCYLRDGDTWTLLPKANGYRLPTEAEWEYACRAGTATQFWFGDDWRDHDKYGWSKANSGGGPRPVGLKPANPFDLYDMHGNVWEWCHDGYDGKWYEKSPSDDPLGLGESLLRVDRGGSWGFMPTNSRSSFRSNISPSHRFNGRGFRPVLGALGVSSSTASVTPQPAVAQEVIYLDDLAETSSYGSFLAWAGTQPFVRAWKEGVFRGTGEPPAHGLILHPRKDDVGRIVYDLGGRYTSFKATVRCGHNRSAPLFIEVVGDDRSLIRSVNLTTVKEAGFPLVVDVRGVRELKIVVDALRVTTASPLAMIDPQLTPLDGSLNTASPSASAKLFMHDPAFPQWMEDVQTMSAEQQIEAVSKKLMELNPGFDGAIQNPYGGKNPRIENGEVVAVWVQCDHVQDISPVRVFSGLKNLSCWSSSPTISKLSDISPLQGLQLRQFNGSYTKISDLTPFQEMPLEILDLRETRIRNLSSLRGMPLRNLSIQLTKIENLTPLEDCKTLENLELYYINVPPSSIAALQKALPNCKIKWDDPAKAKTPQPAASSKLFMHDPAFPQWMKDVQAMPAEQQIEAVRKKLTELNPGFDGKMSAYSRSDPPKITNGVVTAFGFDAKMITDLSPVRALTNLQVLNCSTGPVAPRGKLADLSPLQGMKLGLLYCSNTSVSDLSPLKGMPLNSLFCDNVLVTDFSPLAGMNLVKLVCDDTPVSDIEVLQNHSSLKNLLIRRTKVTPAGVAALQKALPNCKIEWDDPTKPTTSAR